MRWRTHQNCSCSVRRSVSQCQHAMPVGSREGSLTPQYDTCTCKIYLQTTASMWKKNYSIVYVTTQPIVEVKKKVMRWPGVEPGSTAWKATMLTVTPPTPVECGSLQGTFYHYSHTVITIYGVSTAIDRRPGDEASTAKTFVATYAHTQSCIQSSNAVTNEATPTSICPLPHPTTIILFQTSIHQTGGVVVGWWAELSLLTA